MRVEVEAAENLVVEALLVLVALVVVALAQ